MACLKCGKSCETDFHSIEFSYKGEPSMAIYCLECVDKVNIVDAAGCVHCGKILKTEKYIITTEIVLRQAKISTAICSFPCYKEVNKKLKGHAELFRRCEECRKIEPKMFKCGRCKQMWYCSVTCQKLHWSKHKETCKA